MSNAAQQQLESDKTQHVASLQQSKDQFERELASAHEEHLAQFDQKLKEFREEMITLTTNLMSPASQNAWADQGEDADEEDNVHHASGAATSPPSGSELDPPQPQREGMFQGTYPIE